MKNWWYGMLVAVVLQLCNNSTEEAEGVLVNGVIIQKVLYRVSGIQSLFIEVPVLTAMCRVTVTACSVHGGLSSFAFK